MTQRSLIHPANLRQPSLPKKRKFCYLNELPVSKALLLSLKNSKKEMHRRQAEIIERVNYLNRKGKHKLCYMKDIAIKKYLNEEGFDCCKKTVTNDLIYLRKIGLIFSNSRSKPKYKKKGYKGDMRWNGSVRHLITPWNLDTYERIYILTYDKKGNPRPEKIKKAFYTYKNRVFAENFPQHKIARVFIEPTKGIYNYPPIIPPKGDLIVKISKKKENMHHTEKIRRARRPKNPKKYEKIDDQRLIHALTREKSGADALTATTAHAEMEQALATMCTQPQFAGKQDMLHTNFRIAWQIHRDRATSWKKSPLHLAAHATLHGYEIKVQNKHISDTTQENTKIDYSTLQPLLKWGIRTDPAPPEPLPAKAKYTARSLAYALQRDHGDTLDELGYRAETYGIRCVTACSDYTVPYDSPYVFAGLMEKCRHRGLVDIAKWFKHKLYQKYC